MHFFLVSIYLFQLRLNISQAILKCIHIITFAILFDRYIELQSFSIDPRISNKMNLCAIVLICFVLLLTNHGKPKQNNNEFSYSQHNFNSGISRSLKCTDSCRNLNEMLLCASDGRTYKNVCIFMCVFKEINDKIRILYYGKCK